MDLFLDDTMREVGSILYMNLEANSFGVLFHADLGRPRPQRTNRVTEWVLWAGLGGLQEGRVQEEEVPHPACSACAVCLKQHSSPAAVPKVFNVQWSGFYTRKVQKPGINQCVKSEYISMLFGRKRRLLICCCFLYVFSNLGKVFKKSWGGSACKESLCSSQANHHHQP